MMVHFFIDPVLASIDKLQVLVCDEILFPFNGNGGEPLPTGFPFADDFGQVRAARICGSDGERVPVGEGKSDVAQLIRNFLAVHAVILHPGIHFRAVRVKIVNYITPLSPGTDAKAQKGR